MMFGMLKDLGNKLVGDQARTLQQAEEGLGFLPQDVIDHRSLEKRGKTSGTVSGKVSGAAVLV